MLGGFRFPGTNTPFNFRWDQDRLGTIRGAIKEAVRDGYSKLDESLGSYFSESAVSSPIGRVSGNRAQISLGPSNSIQKGDIFYIYPGSGGRARNSSCHNIRRQGPHLATASVIGFIDEKAVLEITGIQNTRRQVQPGDIAEISPEVDLHSRYESRQQDESSSQANQTKKRSLKIGFLPRVILTYRR